MLHLNIKESHPLNASSTMFVTLSGITMLLKLLQSINARLYIFATPDGIVTLSRSLQPINAPYPILFIVSLITVFAQPNIKLSEAVLMIALQELPLLYEVLFSSTLILSALLQPLSA